MLVRLVKDGGGTIAQVVHLCCYLLLTLLSVIIKKKSPRIIQNLSILSFTKFVRKSNNIYHIKQVSYKNIFYDV
jgi:hypothetical protein